MENSTKLLLFIVWFLGAVFGFATCKAMADVTVRDGDTIVVNRTPIRLEGLHCPELKTGEGKRAKTLMQAIVDSGPEITCQLSGKQSYDREVGYCQASGVDLGIIMIQSDLCQPCRRYDRKGTYNHLSVTGWVPAYCKG